MDKKRALLRLTCADRRVMRRVLLLASLVVWFTTLYADAQPSGLYRFKSPHGLFYESATLRSPLDYVDGDSVFPLFYDPPRQQLLDLAPFGLYYVAAKQVQPLLEGVEMQLLWELSAMNIHADGLDIQFKFPSAPAGLTRKIHPSILSQFGPDERELTLIISPVYMKEPVQNEQPTESDIVGLSHRRSGARNSVLQLKFGRPLHSYRINWNSPTEAAVEFSFQTDRTKPVLVHAASSNRASENGSEEFRSLLVKELTHAGFAAEETRVEDPLAPPAYYLKVANDRRANLFFAVEVVESGRTAPEGIECVYEHTVSAALARRLCRTLKDMGLPVNKISRRTTPYTYRHEFRSLLLRIPSSNGAGKAAGAALAPQVATALKVSLQ